MTNYLLEIFKSGVHNLLDDEIIPKDAAQDSLNFITINGSLVLSGGRTVVHGEGLAGNCTGEIWGYRVDGTKVHWRKVGTKIQYDNGTAWVDVVTGLTADADYAFSNYSSLAGAYTFAFGVDGIFKMNNASPGSYVALYDEAVNFKGKAFIDKARSILWDRPEDKTGLYGSWIDKQNGTNFTTVASESVGTGNGVLVTFSDTLDFKANGATRDAFNLKIFGRAAATVNISGITKEAKAAVTTSGAHGLAVGDYVIFASVGGMTEMNGLIGQVTTVGSPTVFLVNINSTAFTTYTSGGTVQKLNALKDNYNGGFTGPGTGTINYITGAVSVTFNSAPLTGSVIAAYQWQDSNNKGVTDFRYSATRLAGEGFVVSQDEGGDPIMNVLIGDDGFYYSIKRNSAYRLAISDDDLSIDNNVYRKELGLSSYRGAFATSKGIVFVNTAVPEKPEMTILRKNYVGDSLEVVVLFPQFDFAKYNYEECAIGTYERFVVCACRSENAVENDTILLCDIDTKTVDIIKYNVRTFAPSDGLLYAGSSLTLSTYVVFTGFDDDGFSIENYWIGKGEDFSTQQLKKYRKLRLKGNISVNQNVEVYVSYDDAGFQLVGTIVGMADYVDYGASGATGTSIVGTVTIGGGQGADAYPFYMEMKLKKVPKFRKRTIKLVCTGVGYFALESTMDWDIMIFEDRIPGRFRQKQNVSLSGTQTDLPNPDY